MASADLLYPRRKLHEDEHEQIGSGASTPPNGTATPRPDLVDKRLPGLVNSYFVQVRDSLRAPSQRSSTSAPEGASTESEERMPENETHSQQQQLDSPASPVSETDSRSPPLLPHEEKHSHPTSQSVYPTPPLSKNASMCASSDEDAGAGVERPRRRSRNTSLQQSRQSFAEPPAQLRRPTFTSALSGVVTKPEVSAHISSPATDSPSSPSRATRSSSRSQDKEERELTSGALRDQNTPPQTPRSGSHESRRGDDGRAQKMARSESGASQPQVPVAQTKGQLEICIEEGRGLKPAVEPYVVCIFQLNEDISAGPKEDEMDTSAIDSRPMLEEDLGRGVAMKRIGSGSGTPLTIPGLRSRQSSSTNIAALRRGSAKPSETTSPVWKHTATFDVVGETNEVDISVYDKSNNEAFIGHVRLPIKLEDYEHQHEDWFKLQQREGDDTHVTGEIRMKIAYHNSGKKTFGPDDFQILKLIGKGTFGQVFQVRKKDTKRIYAMKVLSKKVIVQKKEIQHTIGERNILVRTATTESPFIVGLKFSFQTAADLYLVTDYMSGGELFWHLQKEGRFVEERAKFYIAELILALRHLHQHDIVYRDLKPENILLDANGHIALCDFGLSKANLAKNDTTNTFCGTTEYLAPEVLLDEQGYTKMVDFWSLGVLVFEMCCGWSPFYAEDTQQMYKNIAFGKVRFPRDALSNEGRNFVKGLLNRNPAHRLGAKGDAEELMAHPFFNDVDWSKLSKKMMNPPFKPKLKGELDTSNFDPEFTNALSGDNASSLNARAAALASGINTDSTPLSPTMQNQFKGFTFVDESTLEQQFADREMGMDGSDDKLSRSVTGRSDRMSGIEQTPTSAEGDAQFNHGMLDDL